MEESQIRPLQAVFSAFLAMLVSYIGVVAVPVTVLMVAMIVDYVTGMVAAWHSSELSSKKGVFGIIKKISYLALVVVGMGVDWLIYSGLQSVGVSLGYTFFFGVLVTIWLIINELISILENLGQIGVPLPRFLTSITKRLKKTTENVAKESEEQDEKRN